MSKKQKIDYVDNQVEHLIQAYSRQLERGINYNLEDFFAGAYEVMLYLPVVLVSVGGYFILVLSAP